MITLAIDTATEMCSTALVEDDLVLAEYNLNAQRVHSEKLVVLIRSLCENTGIALNQIDLIAISNGPGSFTGLRIGLSTAKGLAYSLEKPLTPVITLDALAVQAPVDAGKIAALIRARTDEVYLARYEKQAGQPPQRIGDYEYCQLAELSDKIENGTFVLGNGVIAFREKLISLLGERVTLAPDYQNQLRALSTAILGQKQYQAKPKDETVTLEPFYIQEFKVQRKKNAV